LRCLLPSLSIIIDDLGVLLTLVGSVAGGLLCFALPPICWWRLSELAGTPLSARLKCALALEIGIGAVLVATGIAVGIKAAHGEESSVEPQPHTR
jgi:hypothetical protein